MNKSLNYVAVDVDDQAFHLSLLNSATGEVRNFKCRPSSAHLIRKLRNVLGSVKRARICYESTYLGFSLCRELRAQGLKCEVIASSLIPELKGKKVKTDRIDSEKLVEYYSQGLLTTVHVPSESEERVRDLVRTRAFLVSQSKSLRNHILSLCRRTGWDYKKESPSKAPRHWTISHFQWLRTKIKESNNNVLRFNFQHLMQSLEQLSEQVKYYSDEIERLSKTSEYEKKVQALKCFKGIKTIIAMTLVTEIGDIKRFSHPSQLTSYCGLDIIEYSSGGKERKFGSSKMGNPFIRTSVVEACQMATHPPNISRRLKEDRKGQPEVVLRIADKCMKRLYKKGAQLKYKNKSTNKIKVACGRELLGFVWEALNQVS